MALRRVKIYQSCIIDVLQRRGRDLEQNYNVEFLDLSLSSIIYTRGFERNVFRSSCFMRSSALTSPDRVIESLADLFLRIYHRCLSVGFAHVRDQHHEFHVTVSQMVVIYSYSVCENIRIISSVAVDELDVIVM